MANPTSDNLFWDVLKWIAGVGGSLLVIGVGLFFWFLRDYSLRFHNTLTIIFQRIEDLKRDRAESWRIQGEFCRECYALLKRSIEIVKRKNGKDINGG